eukprot:TRINITY_DN30105_c0_g1_i1.p1 TRINITY_DN30105_c0_g1~~TRINITY_DN30105_c0_g1_i1.p1  ORF type:complete len:216 (+),score=57.15 TRINITY_DN30105_c0_g1_i1:44-649(+)
MSYKPGKEKPTPVQQRQMNRRLTSGILKYFNKFFNVLNSMQIPDIFGILFFDCFYRQMDILMFNTLVTNPQMYCSGDHGFHIKLVLSELEEWKMTKMRKMTSKEPTRVGVSQIGLMSHITDAVNLMVLDQNLFTDRELITNLFPNLSLQQIFYLLSHLQPSTLSTGEIPSHIVICFRSWGCHTRFMKDKMILPSINTLLTF